MIDYVLTGAVVISSGQKTVTGFLSRVATLTINITELPIGSPSLTFSITEVDPGDGVTSVGNAVFSSPLSDKQIITLTLANLQSSAVLVRWLHEGTGSFPSVSATLNEKDPNTLGQQTAANSASVIVATDQSPIPVIASNPAVGTDNTAGPTSSIQIGGQDASGFLQHAQVLSTDPVGTEQALVTRNIPSGTQPVSATTLPLPTGAATEATLAGIKTGTDKIPASPAQEHIGAASFHSARLTDGTTFYKGTTPADTQPISAASLPLPTGASTSALQTTGNASLASIDTKTPVLGQAAMAASSPVVVASDQSPITVAPLTDTGVAGEFAFGGDSRLRVGQETLLFVDPFEGAAVNTFFWAQSASGMVQAVSSSAVQLNSTSVLTNGSYSILTTNRNFFFNGEFPLYAQFKARVVPQTNAVIELGFGFVATTAAPTNGVFLRIDATGAMQAVINFGGAETTSATLGSLTSTNYYSFEIFVYEDSVRIDIDNSDGTSFAAVELAIPSTQATPMTVAHFPCFLRVRNSSATGSAANIFLANLSVQQLDLCTNQSWEEQLAAAGRSAAQDPVTGAQLANYTNSAAPATATLSNTAAGYTTLGGLWQFAARAGAETDFALFAYQVPTGYTLLVWSVTITAFITGAQSSTNPTLLQWAVAGGSSAVSLATGAPNPPVRIPIGMQQCPKTGAVGDTFNPSNISFKPQTPLPVYGGQFFHIILRQPVGNATASQIVRGTITVEGVFI